MKFTLLLTSVISALSILPSTNAWGQDGHAIVATIAEVYLHPEVLPALCPLLGTRGKTCSLASVASWADKIRNERKWTAPLHYVNAVADHPPQLCQFPSAKGWEGKKDIHILGAIRNNTDILNSWVHQGSDPSDETASDALKFLIHFVGDLHMPFHLVGRERGANGVQVSWGKRKVKLHGLWDNQLVERAIENTDPKWKKPGSSSIEKHLRGSKYDPLIRKALVEGVQKTWAREFKSWPTCPTGRSSTSHGGDQTVLQPLWEPSETDDDHVCPYGWSAPIHQITCDWAWPKKLDQPPYDEQGGPLLELDTNEYAGKIADEWVIERLLTMAGLRLSTILNLILAPPQDN